MPALTITSDELRSGLDIIAAAAAEVLGTPTLSDDRLTRPRGEEDK